MFTNYKIINNVLYLYVDYKCEIGSIFNSDKYSGIVSNIKKFIKDHKIKFNGTKVILLLSGLMLGTVYLNSDIKVNNYDVYPSGKYVYNIIDENIPVLNKKNIDILSTTLNTQLTVDEKGYDKNITDTSKQVNTNNVIEKKSVTKSDINTANSNQNYTKPDTNDVISSLNTSKIITLRKSNGEVLQMDINEYLIGVVASEMPASFNIEALKAQSVAARTYTLKLLESNRVLTGDISTQEYKNNEELKNMWNSDYETYFNKIKKAVFETNNIVIKYNDKLIDAVYHSTSNGYTEDSINVWGNDIPYLKSVVSPWDTSASSFLRVTDKSFEELSNKMGFDFNNKPVIEIISRDDSNRITKLKINDVLYTGVQLRNILGLRSADFDVNIGETGVSFTTRGYGHGVGMSQYGANSMANSGYNYEQILKYYYTGVEVVNINY